jgi:hypothetical protein
MPTEEELERAAIYEYDAGFNREEADKIAGIAEKGEDVKAASNQQTTLTKREHQMLKELRKSHGMLIDSQNKEDKLTIRRLIAKKLAACDSKGWVCEVSA